MLHINKLLSQGAGLAPALLRRAAHVELDWDVRQKSRFDAVDSLGRALGVFLPRGMVVRGGDVLVAEDGTLVTVRAAAQPVMVVQHDAAHGTPFDLLRAAYHLGNRHVPLQLGAQQLMLEPDHVLADLLRRMHLLVRDAVEPFEPESGAYTPTGHGHERGHDHGHRQQSAQVATAAPAHVHGPDCGHDHGHPHDHAHGHGPQHGHAHPPAAAPAAAPAHVHGPGCGHDHGHSH